MNRDTGVLAVFAVFVAVWISLFFYFEQPAALLKMNWAKEEYSHAVLIPFVALYFGFREWKSLSRVGLSGSLLGAAISVAGVAMMTIANIGLIKYLDIYGLVIILFGMVVAFFGMRGARLLWRPLVLLLFMVPLPDIVFANLSAKLQLISSHIGVEILRMLGVSVYLEGNIIDLGAMKLQVVEACSGLRYLFPLMTLAFIVSVVFHLSISKMLVVVFASIPITIFMNSARIAATGLLVESGHQSLAEGFMHYFEGWVVFMLATIMLYGVVKLFERQLGGAAERTSVHLDADSVNRAREDRPVRQQAEIEASARGVKRGVGSIVAMGLVLVMAYTLPGELAGRDAVSAPRQDFSVFPSSLGGWVGSHKRMDDVYLESLDFDDHILADFRRNDNEPPVELYVAYYAGSNYDLHLHTPNICLAGSGWRVEDFGRTPVTGVILSGKSLDVAKVKTTYGEERLMIYYWFYGRGNIATDRLGLKLQLFWDSLTRRRNDGAFVRVTTQIAAGETDEQAEDRIRDYLKAVSPVLPNFVPE